MFTDKVTYQSCINIKFVMYGDLLLHSDSLPESLGDSQPEEMQEIRICVGLNTFGIM